ncbi:MAG: ABC transporter permease [Acholeplasmatales bacterium]|nr:MAG: ABC transporter permease [Acholeplasmatales bacterium]
MTRYIIFRILWMLVSLFIILSLVYVITRFAMLDMHNPPPKRTMEDNWMIVRQQYLSYMRNLLFSGDWGLSNRGRDVWTLVIDKVPLTLRIMVVVFISFLSIGFGLGLLAAVNEGNIIDTIIGIFTMVFSSLPSFIIIVPLVIGLGYMLQWLPAQYPLSVRFDTQTRLLGLIIPILALSGQPIATFARLVRGEIIETLAADHMLIARAKGLKRNQSIFRHALRNSMVPVLPEIPTMFLFVMLNSFFVESFYGIPGVAKLFLNSVYQPIMDTGYFLIDTNIVVLISAFYAVLGLSANLFVDIFYSVLDPRIRVGAKR